MGSKTDKRRPPDSAGMRHGASCKKLPGKTVNLTFALTFATVHQMTEKTAKVQFFIQ
ncbi:hypothetical protein [Paenibacillus cisolokensis]|uniref:hypothetical protein n=1 Tax=Paenibacillus cisolokensis TaxID=1658519 RepID=UPI001BCFB2C9|nr:hypothetical protein [Paenibacillus cisolokensis]